MNRILPIGPTLLGLTVDHEETTAGPVTLIVRRFDRPELCRLCPRDLCDHRAGFCAVRVRGAVPDEECADYTLEPPAAWRVERN